MPKKNILSEINISNRSSVAPVCGNEKAFEQHLQKQQEIERHRMRYESAHMQQPQTPEKTKDTDNPTADIFDHVPHHTVDLRTFLQRVYYYGLVWSLEPNHSLKRVWDAVSVLFVTYVCFSIPFRIGFYWVCESSDAERFHAFLRVWFLADMILNFFTAYYEFGVLVFDRKKIASNYLRTWFIVDLIPFLDTNSHNNTLKVFKFIRLVKLLRLTMLFRQFRQYQKYIGVTVVLASSIYIIHLTACTWTAAVAPCGSPLNKCTESADIPECDQKHISVMYSLAVHYALSILLGTSNDVLFSQDTPFSASYERAKAHELDGYVVLLHNIIFVIGTLGTAFVFSYTVFVVQSWSRAGNAFRKKMDIVNYEMDYLRLPPKLRMQIKAFFDYVWINNKTMNENLALLNDESMSESLKEAITQHLYKDLITQVPLFKDADDYLVAHVCRGVQLTIYMPGDIVARQGEPAHDVFIVFRGSIEVLGKTDGRGNGRPIFLSSGSFIGELALILKTPRTRSVQACTICEICHLNEDLFDELIRDFPDFASRLQDFVEMRYRAILVRQSIEKPSTLSSADMERKIANFRSRVEEKITARRNTISIVSRERADSLLGESGNSTAPPLERLSKITRKRVSRKTLFAEPIQSKSSSLIREGSLDENESLMTTLETISTRLSKIEERLDSKP